VIIEDEHDVESDQTQVPQHMADTVLLENHSSTQQYEDDMDATVYYGSGEEEPTATKNEEDSIDLEDVYIINPKH